MLTKNELARVLAPVVGGRTTGREVVDVFFDTIVRGVASGERVLISNLGVWEPRVLGPRLVGDPRTGETWVSETKTHVRFTPAPRLRELVAEGSEESPRPKVRGRAAALQRDRERAAEAAARRAVQRAED